MPGGVIRGQTQPNLARSVYWAGTPLRQVSEPAENSDKMRPQLVDPLEGFLGTFARGFVAGLVSHGL